MIAGYGVPAYSLVEREKRKIVDALLRYGPVHIMSADRLVEIQEGDPVPSNAFLLSGVQQFDMRIAPRPGYYIRWADDCIIEDDEHLPRFKKYMDGALVVEICVGNGDKSKKLLTRVQRAGGIPSGYIVNDIVTANLNAAREAIYRTAYPADRLESVHANIFGSYFKDFLRRTARRQTTPIVVLLQGATISNFSHDETGELLGLLSEALRPKDRLIISADSTQHIGTLHQAYDHYVYQQFFVGAYIFACRISGFHGLDYDAIECSIDFKIKKKGQIEVNITNTKDQHVGPAAQRTTVLEAGRPLRAGLMRKWSVPEWSELFLEYGFRLTRAMPARINNPLFRRVNHNYLVFRR